MKSFQNEVERIDRQIRGLRIRLQKQPDDDSTRFRIAHLLLSLHRYREVIEEWQSYIESHPMSADGWVVLASALIGAERTDDAIHALVTASKIAPNNPAFHKLLGEELERQGALEAARDVYESGIRACPNNADLRFLLGRTLEALGHPEDAVASYRSAILEDDGAGRAELFYEIGLRCSALGRSDCALEAYETGVTIDPLNSVIRYNYGLQLCAEGRFDAALQVFKEGLAANPKDGDSLVGLGYAEYLNGNIADALQSYRAAFAIDPENVRAKYHLGATLVQLGQIDEGTSLLASVVASNELDIAESAREILNNCSPTTH